MKRLLTLCLPVILMLVMLALPSSVLAAPPYMSYCPTCGVISAIIDDEAPTCTTPGWASYRCSEHGPFRVAIPATGHNWFATSTIEATCVQDGCVFYSCSVCNASTSQVV